MNDQLVVMVDEDANNSISKQQNPIEVQLDDGNHMVIPQLSSSFVEGQQPPAKYRSKTTTYNNTIGEQVFQFFEERLQHQEFDTKAFAREVQKELRTMSDLMA